MMSTPQEIVTEAEEFVDAIERRSRVWAEHAGDDECAFEFIDGLPGAGKSTIMPMIKERLAAVASDVQIFDEVSVDRFIASDRDSPQRQAMLDSSTAEIFWQRFFFRQAIEYVLGELARIGSRGGEIEVSQMYNRKSGKVEPGTIAVPPGRKIVIVDGVNSISFMRTAPLNGAARLGAVIDRNPEEALRSAALRDSQKGHRVGAEAIEYRKKEFPFMVPAIEENKKAASVIYRPV